MLIVGLAGTKGVGKDTAANGASVLLDSGRLVWIRHYARRLKDTCTNVWSLNPEQTDGSHKESLFVDPINIDERIGHIEELLGLELPRLGMVAETPRQLLQYIGSDYVRSVRSNFWVDTLMSSLEFFQPDVVFIPDTRFPNEVEAIKERNGLVILIERPGVTRTDAHQSEDTSLIDADYVIVNERGKAWMAEELARVVMSRL